MRGGVFLMVLPESSINLFTRSEYAVRNDNVFECWRAKNIDQLRSLNIDQAFYCVAHYATVDKSTRL